MLAADVIERLIDFAGADVGERALRVSRRAMQDALREFPGLHRWTYHYAHLRLQLFTDYSTGTIQYDNATRHLTLTGGTWPAWAGKADVRINDVVSEVASRDSDTQLTLSATVNPGADIAAGSGYVIYEDSYTLPADFLASDSAIAETWFGELQYVHPSSHLWGTRSAQRQGPPQYYTFLPDRALAGRYAAVVWPYPDRDQTLDSVYQRRMRAIRFDNVTLGKVTVTSGSATIVGTGTAWTSAMVGSYIRIGFDSNQPTGVEGMNPYAIESKITAVASATSLTIADTPTQTLNGVNYLISDPLDLEDGVMASAFCWQAMKHMANELRMKDRAAIENDAMIALIRAKEHDARNFARQTAGPNGFRRTSRRYMPTGPDEP